MTKANKKPVKNNGNILIISRSDKNIFKLVNTTGHIGYASLTANGKSEALNILKSTRVLYILIDVDSFHTSCKNLIRFIRTHSGYRYIPILIVASTDNEELLSHYNDEGCDDYLFKPFNSVSLNARLASLKQIRDLKYLYKDSLNEQLVAKRILNNALEGRSLQFTDIGILRKSKSVFSGDLFLTARHPDGSLNILLADFTGHGLSAAIGALPVADVFSVMTEKGFDLDYILENINSKLYTLLPTSMFMACGVLSITKDLKCLKAWNGGMPDIFVRAHGSGDIRHRIKSSHIPLGINADIRNRFELQVVNLHPDDQLIMYTDGLTDAMNSENEMFGLQKLDQCLQENRADKAIFVKIVDSFNEFCGDVIPQDDVTLACIPCSSSLMCANKVGDENYAC